MVKDFLGQEIMIGDVVVYPTRWGSSMDMNIGRVTEIVEKKSSSTWQPPVRIQIEKIQRKWPKESAYLKTTNLVCPERIVVVNRDWNELLKEHGVVE